MVLRDAGVGSEHVTKHDWGHGDVVVPEVIVAAATDIGDPDKCAATGAVAR